MFLYLKVQRFFYEDDNYLLFKCKEVIKFALDINAMILRRDFSDQDRSIEFKNRKIMIEKLLHILQSYAGLLVIVNLFTVASSTLTLAGTSSMPNFAKTVRCYGYISLRVCTVYPTTPSNSSIYIYDPFISVFNFQANAVMETFSGKGLLPSYSRPVRYLVSSNAVGAVYSVNESSTGFTTVAAHDYSSYHSFLVEGDKQNGSAFFYAFVSVVSGANYTTAVCYRVMPSATCTPLFTLGTKAVALSVNEYGWAHILHVDLVLNTLSLTLFLANGSVISTLSRPVLSGLATVQFALMTTYEFGFYSLNNSIYSFDSTTMNLTWNWTSPATLMGAYTIYPWVVAYARSKTLYQFHIKTGMSYGTVASATLYNAVSIVF